jgi:hypothetical protein
LIDNGIERSTFSPKTIKNHRIFEIKESKYIMPKYVEIPAPNGTAWLNILDGTVVHRETQRWSETRVTSSGGGGYVNPTYGGYVAPPTINSHVSLHEKNIFWVQEIDGTQKQFCFNHNNFPVATGHRVRIIWGGSKKNTNNGDYLYFQNFTSGNQHHFNSKDISNWAFKNGLIQWPLLYSLIFRWPPILTWIYLVLILIPLIKHESVNSNILAIIARNSNIESFADFLNLNLQLIPHWSFSLLMSSFTDYRYWGMLIIGIFACLVSTLISACIGYLLFGCWWSKTLLKPFRDRVALACRE